jgi:hypothetical protein
MAEYFNEGGFGMYPTALLGLLLLAAAGIYAARPERRCGPLLAGLALALGLLVLAALIASGGALRLALRAPDPAAAR